MSRQNGLTTKRSRAGFTLVELVVVVAIFAVLLSVFAGFLGTIKKNLRQRELDSKAETIYVAIQMRMAELKAAGFESPYKYSTTADNGVEKLGLIPCDAEADSQIKEDTLCYVTSEKSEGTRSTAAEALVPEGVIDEALRSNNWVIEYNPDSGRVYGVFYSETEELTGDVSWLDDLRSRKKRLRNGATVGYYGGDAAQTETTQTITPSMAIENNEQLTATFYCNNPSVGEKLTFVITLSDGKNTFEKTVSQSEMEQVTARTYKYVWVLDSLKSQSSRFYEQTKHKLEGGTKLTISLSAKSTDSLVDAVTIERTTNSLFAYREGTASDTALISYARHLQNLDEGSHVTDKITKAIQISDLSFDDDANDDKDWYTLYGDTFSAIENDALKSYTGRSALDGLQIDTSIAALHISGASGKPEGLFATFSGELSYVTLTGVRIDKGSDVGALVGESDGALTITGCQVYLSAKNGDLENAEAAAAAEVKARIKGTTAGGLVGRSAAALTITDSFASTVVSGTETAGGLVGSVDGRLTGDGIYADSYLQAPVTGGLFGSTGSSADITLTNFYAAGYQVAEQYAAGIGYGSVTSAKNGYSACDFGESKGSTYSTVLSGSMTNVFYLTGSNPVSGTAHRSYAELSGNGAAELGSSFTGNSGGATYPYNLLNQGLSSYSYPRLTKLEHYGDWQAEFDSGLVYYERYTDGSIAFEGANVSTLRSGSVAVGDGYALAYTGDGVPAIGARISVTYGSAQTSVTFSVSEIAQVAGNGETYYLVPLPREVTNPSLDGAAESFYQKITISDGNGVSDYYYNPYFAKTVISNDGTPAAPATIYIRTARQLYGMSRYYGKYAQETKKSVFEQELDLDYSTYQWSTYSGSDTAVASQAPIDSSNGFLASYNGNYHEIRHLSIVSEAGDTGLFGTIAGGAGVRNLILCGETGTSRIVRYVNGGIAASGSKYSSQIGALCGINNGTINNCAVSGYMMSYYGYNANTVTIGGLVGTNNGTIRSCCADVPQLSLAASSAYGYAGGFAGRNFGTIASCYATGWISVPDARNSTVWIAGFAGNNEDGITRRCYAATALTASGSSESYGFARIGGAVAECYYLDGGTYSYAGSLYAYNTSNNEFARDGLASGTRITGESLQNLKITDFGTAQGSYEHEETGTASDGYLYPAVVRKGSEVVHYGNWPVPGDIGVLGIFYWEYEDYGSNSGYHFSYIGTDNGVEIAGDSLCVAHDDGGAVTSYGYGYFYSDNASMDPVSLSKSSNCILGDRETEAETEIEKQMPGYRFVAYKTAEDGTRLNTDEANATWTLTCGDATYSYTICPFFADSMCFDTMTIDGNKTSMGGIEPGTEDNSYQIRSTQQLQFINWEYKSQTASKSVTYSSTGNYQYYTYLSYLGYKSSSSNYTKDRSFVWNQSHDLDANLDGSNTYFTPIGGLYDAAELTTDSAKLYSAYFSSTYNGRDYTIKNIEISSTAQCIGLFGFTSGADMQNIVLYSDEEGGSTIENLPGGTNWYSMGGLVGFAGSRNLSTSKFVNCTVSGYHIIDHRGYGSNLTTNPYPGWGGGCVGGLVGATNMPIEGCTAVTDITIQIGYNNSYTNLRVGGIAGVSRGSFDSCYAGGSIESTSSIGSSGPTGSSSIWAGGVVGGIVLRSSGNISSLVGTVTNVLEVKNCYSYVDMPTSGSTGANGVRNSQSIASNGELQCTAYGKITNSNIIIRNSYAYVKNITGCDDYRYYASRSQSSWNGVRMDRGNNSGSSDSGRYITLYNSYSPYLTYTQMSNGTMMGYLSASSSRFATVTVEEHGAAINGKYSFPGDDTQLKEHNYPFPTVLTQTDAYDNQVNVHYGTWPKNGIYWEEPSATLDLYSSRKAAEDTGELVPLLTMKLYTYGDGTDTLSADDLTFLDDSGEELSADTCPILLYSIGTYTTDSEGGYYPVTFRGTREGTVYVKCSLNGGSAQTAIEVVSRLSIKASANSLTLESGEEQNVTLTFYTMDEKDEEQLLKPEKAKLSWTVTIKSGEDSIICGDDSVSYDAKTGVMTLSIKGGLPDSITKQEGHVSITCTYTYGNGENEKMTATADILTETVSPDFADLKMGNSNSGYRFWHYGDTAKREVSQLASQLAGDGLFLRGEYTTYSEISLAGFTLTVEGETYTANDAGEFWKTPQDPEGEAELLARVTLAEGDYDQENKIWLYGVEVTDYTKESEAQLSVFVNDDTTLTVTIPRAESEEPTRTIQEGQPEDEQNTKETS